MLHKWKSILINWINCYFNDDRKEQNLNLESLLNIITHLRDNLNLDESKSSKISAHSVEEFITEKYPEFKFDNGTVEATNEDQVYLAASLLLYFVCVNSKDIDIKSAMCSKLSDRDQEIILKFSKSLLECSPILCRDVQTAIADACGHDVATVSTTTHVQVAETPPALRSLHSEVRRLQAALDAERFDRNYLQDELNRTNLRVEKLLKEKEEHKMDIVNLKTKISLCCGQEDEARGTESSSDKSAKLARQLQEMEERLVQTQGELDDAVYERDSYKAKAEELKQHCDKWLTMSQQETIRANQLSEELEIERRNTQSLRELVNELRQHNRLNRIDSSFLECDDPDASIQSLPHNSSICSEVCANVVEVQLGEERAKIVVLKQQIQAFHDQINDITCKFEDEKLTLESIISERETDIFNLKHRINEEIEEKNNLRAYFSDEMSKLNNEINELEQKLKDNNENSRAMIENKMQEIQTLQEEKISLLQSLSDETTKLKNIIKDLKISIDTEKQSKINMKESYDSHIMKLNEKMLNRNNELVELQNNVFEKSEMIESLYLDLRSEKEIKEDLSKQYHDDIAHLNEQKNAIEHCLQERMNENSELKRILEQKTNMIEGLYRQTDNLQLSLSHCNDNCRILEEDNSKLLKEIYNRDNKLEEIYKDNENLKNVFSEERAIRDALECEKMQLIEEKQVLTIAVNEEKSAVDEMQNEKNILSHKIDEISEQFNSELISKAKEIENVKSEIEHFKMDYHNQLQCNTEVSSNLNAGLERIKQNFRREDINNEILQQLAADTTHKSVVEKCNLLMNIVDTLFNEVNLKKKLDKALKDKNTALSEMQEICKQKEMQILDLQTDVKRINQVLNEKKIEMSKQTEVHTTAVSTKARELQQLQHENETLRNDLNDVKLQLEVKVHSLKEKLTDNEHLTDKLKTSYECQIDNLNIMINKLTAYLKDKTVELETTRNEKESLQHTIEENLKAIKELAVVQEEKVKIEKELQLQKENMDKEFTKLRDEINLKSSEIDQLQINLKTVEDSLQNHKDVINSLETEIQTEKKNQEKIISDFEAEQLVLKNMVTVTESVMEDQKMNLDSIIAEQAKINESLQEENKILKDSLGTEKNNTQLKLQDKNNAIEKALKELATVQEEKIQIEKVLQSQKENMDKEVTKLRDEINLKSSEIDKLQIGFKTIEESLQKHKDVIKSLETEIQTEKKNQDKLISDFETERLVLKNMVTNAESMMEEQKIKLNNIIAEHVKINERLQEEIKILKDSLVTEKNNTILKLKYKDVASEKAIKELAVVQEEKVKIEKELQLQQENMAKEFTKLRDEINLKSSEIDQLQINLKTVEDSLQNHKDVINSLETEIQTEKKNQEKIISDFETERVVLKNMVASAESVMEEQKINLKNIITEYEKNYENLQEENKILKDSLETEKNNTKLNLQDKDVAIEKALMEFAAVQEEKIKIEKVFETQKENMDKEVTNLKNEINLKSSEIDKLQVKFQIIEESLQKHKDVINSLETEIQTEKMNQEKIISDFEAERLVLKNMVTVTESVMEEQKMNLDNIIAEQAKINESLQEENKILKDSLVTEKNNTQLKLQDKDVAIEKALKELATVQEEKIKIEKVLESQKENMDKEVTKLRDEINLKSSEIDKLQIGFKTIEESLQKYKDDLASLQGTNEKLKVDYAAYEIETRKKISDMATVLNKEKEIKALLETELFKKTKLHENILKEVEELREKVLNVEKEKQNLVLTSNEWKTKYDELQARVNSNEKQMEEALEILRNENIKSLKTIEDQKIVITRLEQIIKHELEENQTLRDDNANEKLTLVNKFSLLQDWQTKAEKDIEEKQKEISSLQEKVVTLRSKIENYDHDLKAKDELVSEIRKEKDAIVSTISRELLEEKTLKEKWQKECENKVAALFDREAVEIALRKENEELVKAVGERETFAVQNEEKLNKYQMEMERNRHPQVDNSSELSQSSMESFKTITDLEKIIHDKNRTITTLQSDITYLKTLMAESETKLMDVTNDLEVSKENCHQLSSQLKKIVYQKNEEIAELKKQVNKMSVTENRATQIIKVSAKYQAIILKRIAEIKSNTVLKELTNFGNTNNSDNELRRSLNVGTVTMEELESFLETTDKHLKRCSEKQIALQKERDRLSEVNRINESEIINLKKFLTELSVSFQTFNSMRDLYSHKLSRVVSIQRTVRREILSLDGLVTDACMCKMERGYAAVMQDLAECSMNLERWVERCVSRAISPEKIKQAFMGDYERASLASTGFQNAGLEVQLEELDCSFQKLLEEVARATKGDGVRDPASVTVQEVRAEYEDKLNRMKAKMKQLYQEQIGVFKQKQREEVVMLEREVQKAREKLAESSHAYEEHIRALTTELWNVGEKFLMKKNESEWLRRKQRSGSLMSLQHVHSSGLVPTIEEPDRPSDAHSLRSLPVNNNANNNTKREGRGLHMSDEEGEVFDNRFLKELSTPRQESGVRLSELKRRNSLCPPHLKSSYPAETQFAPALDEEDIKFAGVPVGRPQRKEVGITAYKKPGPPTPSKQAGRLSATDSELRESLRVEVDPLPSRKTSTPSRIRALFRTGKNETNEGTPRSRRLSNIFRKK